jgi:hypothetical protein
MLLVDVFVFVVEKLERRAGCARTGERSEDGKQEYEKSDASLRCENGAGFSFQAKHCRLVVDLAHLTRD